MTDQCVPKLSFNTNLFPHHIFHVKRDLVLEAEFLTSLRHPNVIKLRGIAHSGVEGILSDGPEAFFLILDRVTETLETRLRVWHDQHRSQTKVNQKLDSFIRNRILSKNTSGRPSELRTFKLKDEELDERLSIGMCKLILLV